MIDEGLIRTGWLFEKKERRLESVCEIIFVDNVNHFSFFDSCRDKPAFADLSREPEDG